MLFAKNKLYMFLVLGYGWTTHFAVSIPQTVYLKFNLWINQQIFIHWYGCFKKIFWVHGIQIQRTPIGLLVQLQVKQLVWRWKVMCTFSPRRIDHADLRMYHWHTVYPPAPTPPPPSAEDTPYYRYSPCANSLGWKKLKLYTSVYTIL